MNLIFPMFKRKSPKNYCMATYIRDTIFAVQKYVHILGKLPKIPIHALNI